jgi:glucose-6-phosphate isomerase
MPARRRSAARSKTGSGRAERVRLDYTGSLRDTVGAAGLTREEIAAACGRASAARDRLKAMVDAGKYGFDEILDDRRTSRACAAEGQRLARLASTLVVDGIGGSALGALALQTALGTPRKRLVTLDNVDPEGVSQKLAGIDWKRAAAIVITKSGSTAETMANMLVLLDRMEKALGPAASRRRWTAVTDPEKGDLKVLAGRLGLPTFSVPPNVGGRFSVLTPVGLIPAAFLGIDVEELLEGARAMRKHCWSAAPEKNVGVLGSVLLHQMATRRGRSIQVVMPYADRLVHLADWYKQLWGESLGKRLDRKGRVVETGQTPVTALGATDQHSQVQLYVEGPHDKVITFLELQRYRKDVRIPRLHQDLASFGYLTGRTLGELLTAEKKGTEVALSAAGRPTFTYVVPEISAHTLGQLIYLFEFQTALSGELYDVDAFDQPGVEAGKVAAYALMGRAGYEQRAAELKRELRGRRAVI